PKIFQALLEAGADPRAADDRGETVLHYAATYGTPTLVRLLLEKNPDVNARDQRGQTPLMAALTAPVAELLLQAGADVNARRNDGLTMLDLCAGMRQFQGGTKPNKLEQLLRAAGAGAEPPAPAPAAPLRRPPKGKGRLRSPSAKDVEEFFTAAQTDDAAKLRAVPAPGGAARPARGGRGPT